jgi:hypothetical protein
VCGAAHGGHPVQLTDETEDGGLLQTMAAQRRLATSSDEMWSR